MRALAVALALAAVAAVPAFAASAPALRVAPSVATGNTALTLRGAGFRPHRAITVYFGFAHGVKGRLLTARTDASGSFRRSFKLGPTWSPGRYVFSACSSPCRAQAYAHLRLR